MTKDRTSIRFRTLATDFLFYLLLFSYPILSLLWRRSYPLFSTEVFLLLLVVVGISVFLSLITSKLRPAISYPLMGVSILITAMIQFNLVAEGLAICAGIIALAMFVFKQRFRSFCLPVFAALTFGAYLDSKMEPIIAQSDKNSAVVAAEMPPVIHIMLDSFIGIGGLPEYPASNLIRQEMLTFFEANDFQVYSHAYSRYAMTGDSLYSSMNYQHDGVSNFALEKIVREAHVMKDNAVFTTMEKLGYRLNVYQTGHVDMCQSNRKNLDRCWQYDHPNIRSVISSNDIKFRLRALVVVLLNQSILISKFLLHEKRDLAILGITNHDPQMFEELQQDILAEGWGNYYYAHALIPHGPYAYQPDCSVNYEVPVGFRVASTRDEKKMPPYVYEMRYGLYFGQIKCALRSLETLFDGMRISGLYDRGIIILHGDHGSAIATHPGHMKHREAFTKENYRAVFSTLFAVKYPGSEFLVDERVLPLSYLLEEFMAGLPSYATGAEGFSLFNPSDEADSEKIDSYIYLHGEHSLWRVDVDFFED